MISRRLTIIVLLVLMLTPSALRAEDDEAKQRSLGLFKQGRASFQAGQYEQAIQTLKQANQLYRHRNNLYYLAASYRRLGKLRRSFALYSDYAAMFSEPGKRTQLLRRYERVLRKAPPCVLNVSATPAGAEVWLDGAAAGRIPAEDAPLRITVQGGQHRVELRAPGYRPALWVVRAEFGEGQQRRFTLVRDQREAAVTSAGITAATAATNDPFGGGLSIEVDIGPSNRSYGLKAYDAWGLDAAVSAGYLWRWGWFGLRPFAELVFAPADAEGYSGFLGVVGGAAGRLYPWRRLWIELGFGLGTTLLLGATPGVFFFHKQGQQVLELEGTFALFCLRPSLGLGVELWRGLSVALRATIYHSPRIDDFSDDVQRVARYKVGVALAWTFR